MPTSELRPESTQDMLLPYNGDAAIRGDGKVCSSQSSERNNSKAKIAVISAADTAFPTDARCNNSKAKVAVTGAADTAVPTDTQCNNSEAKTAVTSAVLTAVSADVQSTITTNSPWCHWKEVQAEFSGSSLASGLTNVQPVGFDESSIEFSLPPDF